MSEDVLVKVEGVSKKFCRSLKRSLMYGLNDLASEMLGRTGSHDSLRPEEFWAVKDVSFELRRGECLGLIGRNGAGKTTLLRMINGLIKPDCGLITVRGRVGALIALGAGFNPILTGRENIYVNGSVLGLTKREIDAKIEEIIDFAEIGDFIDAPVQSYSSGMAVRLGFAVAAVQIRPDILLIDEVLAVGDIGFKIKCLNTVRQIASQSAVVFVSHSMEFVSQFCTRIAVMSKGAIVCDTLSISEGIDRYFTEFPPESTVTGSGGVAISNVQLSSGNRSWQGDEEAAVQQGEELSLSFHLTLVDPNCKRVQLIIHIMDQGGNPIVAIIPSKRSNIVETVSVGRYHVCVNLGPVELNPGKYFMVISAEDADSHLRLIRLQGQGRFRVVADRVHWGRITQQAEVVMQRE